MTSATALLLLLAMISLQLSRSFDTAVGASVTAGLIAFAVLFAARRALHRPLARITAKTRNGVTIGVGAILAVAIVVCSSLSILSLAGEEIVLAGLLALAAALFTCRDDNTSLQQTALLSAVVVLFSLPGIGESYRLPVILAATACGGLWFMVSATAAPKDRWTWAYASAVIVVLIGVGLMAHHRIQPAGDENPWYAAWAPTSGGDGAGDENARRGTGDGPDEISGGSADSLGFDKSDTFSESGRDGLYDLWVESYGTPTKSSDQEKMVGLKPNDVKVVQGNDRENLRVGRSFELRREPGRRPPMNEDVAAGARAWIKGPTPAYIPLAVFTDYDGTAWQVMDHGKPSVPARKTDDHWMEILHRPISPSFDGTDTYEIRAGDLGGEVLPLPPLVERFRMGRVSRPDFFALTRSGLLRLARRNLPAGATLEVVTKRIAPSRLVNVEIALPKHSDSGLLDTGSVGEDVRALATEWGSGRERGWRQVEQVVRRLRDHVTLDRTLAPSTLVEPVRELLLVSRRGPDHQIASASVMLLRSLGYPTRLVSGFFAATEDVESRSGFVPLAADDVHFWIEVRLADGTWVTVDPTPGYPMLNLPTPPGEWLASLWHKGQGAISANPFATGLIVAAIGFGIVLRHRWMDGLATMFCRMRGYPPRLTLRVLELRARMARRPRPASMPAGQWIASLNAGPAGQSFVSELNRVLYREGADRADARAIASQAALSEISFRKLMKERKEIP